MDQKVLARVGLYQITDADVEETLMELGQRAQGYNTPEGRAAVLDQLINQKLFLSDAVRNLYEREPEFKAEMARIREKMLVQYAMNKVLRGVKVSDDEVKAYYDEHAAELSEQKTVNASHILVDSEEKANEILQKIQAGEVTFEAAARQFSSCPSAADGGCLGDFGRGQMVPEFDAACFSMKEGEIRGPIKTQFGYHIIRLNKITALTFARIKDELKQELMEEKQKKAYQSKINQLKIMVPVDKY